MRRILCWAGRHRYERVHAWKGCRHWRCRRCGASPRDLTWKDLWLIVAASLFAFFLFFGTVSELRPW